MRKSTAVICSLLARANPTCTFYEMETEMQRLETPRSMATSASSSIIDDPKYVSLRDVIAALDSPSRSGAGGGGGSGWGPDFDSSTISIRNQLVKHAASAYLQSAAILAARDEGCLSRLWRRVLRQQAALQSAWRGCVQDPLDACVGFVARSVRLAVVRMAGRLGSAFRAWRTPIA